VTPPLGNPSAAFLNISKEEIARELHDNFWPANNAVPERNIPVANLGDRVVLFDTGMGTGASTGKLMGTLKQAGIDPAGVRHRACREGRGWVPVFPVARCPCSKRPSDRSRGSPVLDGLGSRGQMPRLLAVRLRRG
jgi:hypothetical protein